MGKWLHFWLLLREDDKHWDSFVRENLFIKGKAKNHSFGSKDLSFSVVSLRLNFKQPRRQLFSGFWTAHGDSCSLCNNCWGLCNLLRPEKSFWHVVKNRLKDLSRKTSVMIQPVFVSQKIDDLLKIREKKPSIVNQQRVVYKFSCEEHGGTNSSPNIEFSSSTGGLVPMPRILWGFSSFPC